MKNAPILPPSMRVCDIYHGKTYRSRALGWDLFVVGRSGTQLQYEVKTGPKAGAKCLCSVSDFAERVTREVPNHVLSA
jgi:hypothetical protein